LFNFLKKKNKEQNKINVSSVKAMSVAADIIAVNNKYGHYEIGDEIGKTYDLKIENYILVFKGGILVNIIERK
jgi:hypothetical protein